MRIEYSSLRAVGIAFLLLSVRQIYLHNATAAQAELKQRLSHRYLGLGYALIAFSMYWIDFTGKTWRFLFGSLYGVPLLSGVSPYLYSGRE